MSGAVIRRPTVYVTRRIPQKGVDVLLKNCNVSMWDSEDPVTRGELLLNVEGVDSILCMSNDVIGKEVLDAAGPNLKVVITVCETLDSIDVEMCNERGIRVLACPNKCSESKADLVVALLVLTLKRAAIGPRENSTGEHSGPGNDQKWINCANRTFGIYGFNTMGQTIAKRLQDVGVKKIIAYDSNSYKMCHDSKCSVEFVDWKGLLSRSDVVCICDPNAVNSNACFNKEAFDQMKPNAVIVVGESDLSENLDFIDLYDVLRDGKFLAVGINSCNQGSVPFRYPLSGLHNCVFLPQTQESSFDARHKTSVAAANRLLFELSDINANNSSKFIA